MLGSDLQICAISVNKLKKELWKNPEQVKVLWSKQINLTTIKTTNSTISDEYRDFIKLFADEALEEALLAHQSWDHKILIIEDKTSEKILIYSLLLEKLKVLCMYLNKKLKKEFIRESQSSAEYSILFILKKNKTL